MKRHSLRRITSIAVLALASVAVALFQTSAPARASTGSNLASFDATVTAGVPACGVGTGIAFDGTNLYLSCWSSNVLQRVVAAGAHGSAGPLTIAGMTDIRAMAFDASRGKIWACEGTTQVRLIDLVASQALASPSFPVAGCQDGLAYDGADDTIWASPDANDTIYHYSLGTPPNGPAGTLIASFSGLTAKLGGNGNSGIAVGGVNLYLGNDGGSQIYQCDKGLVTCTLMSTFPARIEDLECDNVTFPGKNAIWSQDAYDRILNAWEIPAGTCGVGGQANPPGPGSTVPTTGVIGVSGVGPVIECKWELPDMDSSTAGIQYTKAPGHLHDDDMTITPGPPVPCHGPGDTPATKPTQANGIHHMIQVAPNFENLPEQRQIQNWMAVDDPGTVSDTFWIVWEPCTTVTNPLCGLAPAPAPNLVKKLQVHGTQLGAGTAQPCTSLFGTSTTDGSMIEAAVHTGQVTADSFTDLNKGMISLCNQNVKGLYHAEWPLSKDQPCGEYRIDATAVSVGGATTTLTNYIDILCTFQLKIDFGGDTTCAGGITWPALVPGSTSTVGGDLIFLPTGCDTHPTVKNVGNSGMGLKLTYSDLVGATFGKHIYTFDACYGRAPDATLKCFPSIINQPAQTTPTSPEIDTTVDFGTLPAQVLCANELGKLDPSVHPQAGLPADTYNGTATLVGYAVPGECFGNKHVGVAQ